MDRSYIDLYTLQTRVKTGMEALFPDRIWVKAEIAGLSRKPNGHCYLELSQSGPGGLVAKSRAVIWASRIGYVDAYFKSVTGASLDVGMEILARVQVSYRVLYGLTLTIDEVDPEFTLAKRSCRRSGLRMLAGKGCWICRNSLASVAAVSPRRGFASAGLRRLPPPSAGE